MASAHGIEAEGLVRTFKGDIKAVDGIDLRVDPGEIYGFLGPNGAGKSTTVHMLTTLLPPTAGTARVAGFDIVKDGPKVRQAIGAALQEAALDNLLTGREHLRLQCACTGSRARERKVRAQELLERVGLTLAADRKVGGYSGGMKRRLDLALALAHRPSILFLDEPTTGLDPQSRSALWNEVARLAREDGVTVFLTTQYLEEADALADRVGIIDHGHIVAEGTPVALKAQIGRPTVEAIPGDGSTPEALARILERFGEPTAARRRASRCGSSTASRTWPESSGRSTRKGSSSRASSCTLRAWTTSSSRRPAARSKARPKRRRKRPRSRERARPGRPDRAALDPAHGAPARQHHLPVRLPDRRCSRSLRPGSAPRRSCRAFRRTRSSRSSSPSRSSRARSSRR